MKISSFLTAATVVSGLQAANDHARADTWTVYRLKGDPSVKVEAESLEVTSGGSLIFTNTINGTKKIIKVFSPWSFTHADRELPK